MNAIIATHYLNLILGAGSIILQILATFAFFLLFFISSKKSQFRNKFLGFIEKHFLIIGFLIAFFASCFSLVYSEIINFVPCHLCWYQRIFLFPQVFLFGIAIWNKDKSIIKYSLPLLCVGFIVSIYQNFIYYFGNSSNIPCDASGVSCYQHLISEFGGYISFPMMALIAFFALIVLELIVHFSRKEIV